jgi:hypothetical protein
MTKFEKYFMAMFLFARVNEANFVRFVEDHLQRLIANNAGGKYTPLITALTALLHDYKAAIDQRNLNQALQESKTMLVDQTMSAFKTLLCNKVFEIKKIWPETDPVFEQFFPHGMEEYQSATKGNFGSLMNRFLGICDLHEDDLPEKFTEPFILLKTSYETGRPAQLNLIGTTDGNRLNVAAKREAVTLQTTIHLLTLALDFLGKPEMVPVYFDQSIIRRPVKQNGNEPVPVVYSDAVAPGAKVVILHGGFDANTLIHVVNTGSVDISIYTANMVDDPVSGNALVLAPGEEDDVMASELGGDKNLFLMAYNGHATLPGSYEVSLETE